MRSCSRRLQVCLGILRLNKAEAIQLVHTRGVEPNPTTVTTSLGLVKLKRIGVRPRLLPQQALYREPRRR